MHVLRSRPGLACFYLLPLPSSPPDCVAYVVTNVVVRQVSSFFETFPYRLDESTGQIDYDTMAANAKLFRPKV